ncbi:MAG: D-aminoacyl-tRNA deacylase [Armatimonadota bacterium]
MRVVIQRVRSASVSINDSVFSMIGHGVVILLGVGLNDSEDDAHWLAEKIANLRIFEDEQGKMNLSLADINGEALVVSQFTLYADVRKGRRPSFTDAAPPEKADALYRYFIGLLDKVGIATGTGIFGADMLVDIQNDGPVTILLDTDTLAKKP